MTVYKKYKDKNLLKTDLNNWFSNRGIPSWRDKLDVLLNRLNVNTTKELLDKALGLSLSDQYWLMPYGTSIMHKDINFFENDFDYVEFLDASLSKNNKIIKKESSLKYANKQKPSSF